MGISRIHGIFDEHRITRLPDHPICDSAAGIDSLPDQLGAVIHGKDRNSLRQTGLKLLDSFFDPVNDGQSVLALAHDNDEVGTTDL